MIENRLHICARFVASAIALFILGFIVIISGEYFNESSEETSETTIQCSSDYDGYCLNGGNCFCLVYEKNSILYMSEPIRRKAMREIHVVQLRSFTQYN